MILAVEPGGWDNVNLLAQASQQSQSEQSSPHRIRPDTPYPGSCLLDLT